MVDPIEVIGSERLIFGEFKKKHVPGRSGHVPGVFPGRSAGGWNAEAVML